MLDAGGTTATVACVFTPHFPSVSKDSFRHFTTSVVPELISNLLLCYTLSRQVSLVLFSQVGDWSVYCSQLFVILI